MRTADTSKVEQARHFISEDHLSERTLESLSAWYESVPSRPIHLREFLKPEWANSVAEMLNALPIWTRVCRVYDGPDGARYVTEAEWELSDKKWARSWIGTPLDHALDDGVLGQRHRKSLEQFLAFSVLDGPLTAWLQAATGVVLGPRGTIELAAYSEGDQIGEHQDRIEERAFAVNFYLDPEYIVGSGGRLGYRNEAGETYLVDPVFNSVSIIPIQPESVHWVEKFAVNRRGRLTISVGQNRRGGEA